MENFTNETIDTSQLPKFEEVQFTVLHPNYWKVTLISCFILIVFIFSGMLLGLIFIKEFSEFQSELMSLTIVLIVLILLFSRIAFRKKRFAFRNHDVLFRHGIIATNTIVIPYNRIQHVALHEGLVSRYFGLAKIEIFTAGGSASNIEIPGIEKEQAENIKQLLMGKIQKQL